MKFLVTGGTGFIGQRVVKNLVARQIPVVVADRDLDQLVINRLRQSEAGDTSAPKPNLEFLAVDVSDFRDVMSVFHQHPDITHVVHLAYLMSAECEGNPHLAVRVNVLGMVNLFEAAVMQKLTRLIFTSSETYYGTSQENYGNRAVVEGDFCSPSDHFYIYGMMKILNEFMAEKYVKKHGVSIACTRPPVVFGYGRKRGSVLWAEDFATKPARGENAMLPFPAETRNSFIYV